MQDVRDLYQQIILDHSRHPRNFRELPGASRVVDGVNPLCGDKITLFVNLSDDKISAVTFQGSGCAISQSSASLMTAAVSGLTIDKARALAERFHELVTVGVTPEESAALGKLAAFDGVREFPSRVKCATLCWHALRSALAGDGRAVSTE